MVYHVTEPLADRVMGSGPSRARGGVVFTVAGVGVQRRQVVSLSTEEHVRRGRTQAHALPALADDVTRVRGASRVPTPGRAPPLPVYLYMRQEAIGSTVKMFPAMECR
jgi:hypothetical protein